MGALIAMEQSLPDNFWMESKYVISKEDWPECTVIP